MILDAKHGSPPFDIVKPSSKTPELRTPMSQLETFSGVLICIIDLQNVR